jgi:aminopeptidase S
MDLCTTTNSTAWQQTSVNLSAYAGQTVTLSFLVLTDVSLLSTFLIDDVVLQ